MGAQSCLTAKQTALPIVLGDQHRLLLLVYQELSWLGPVYFSGTNFDTNQVYLVTLSHFPFLYLEPPSPALGLGTDFSWAKTPPTHLLHFPCSMSPVLSQCIPPLFACLLNDSGLPETLEIDLEPPTWNEFNKTVVCLTSLMSRKC